MDYHIAFAPKLDVNSQDFVAAWDAVAGGLVLLP